jgi:hypothetical protein
MARAAWDTLGLVDWGIAGGVMLAFWAAIILMILAVTRGIPHRAALPSLTRWYVGLGGVSGTIVAFWHVLDAACTGRAVQATELAGQVVFGLVAMPFWLPIGTLVIAACGDHCSC